MTKTAIFRFFTELSSIKSIILNLNQDCNSDNRLFGGIQSCEKQYPVYGDDSRVTSTAASIDSVYARIERTPDIKGGEADYFMWGSYLKEEQGAQDFELYGDDFYAPLGAGFILGEYARSQHNTLNFGSFSDYMY